MTWKTRTVLALTLILGSTGIEAQRPQSPSQGQSGFQTRLARQPARFVYRQICDWLRRNGLGGADRLRLNATVSSSAMPKCSAASSPSIGMMQVSATPSSVPTMRI